MFHILYNSLSKSGKNQKNIREIEKIITDQGKEFIKHNVIAIPDMAAFLDSIAEDDEVVLVGGDGTAHYAADQLKDKENIVQKIYLYAAGTGNDFVRNIGGETEKLILINDYIRKFPRILVNNKESIFINGCGIGVDAAVCDGVNKGNNPNKSAYIKIALKAFLKYKPSKAVIKTEDGEIQFNKVWVTCVMNGKHQGGGMPFVPDADITTPELDLLCLHSCSRLKVFIIFANLLKGTHFKFKKNVFHTKAKHIHVKVEKPSFFQYDGEVIENIDEMEVFVRER